MRDAAIFDMDGTLVDVSSIRYLVNPKHPSFPGKKLWEQFHGKSIDCPPHQQALDLYEEARDTGFAIIVVSARMRMWAFHTLLWLREHGIEHEQLYMRRMLDFRPDVVVKKEILDRIRADGYNPVMAVDDNPAIIELWKSEGITTHIIPGWEET